MTEEVQRLVPGDKVPEFELQDQNGVVTRSSELFKTPTILYFFPAAGSPGCTKEASDFESRMDEFDARGYQIVGVSPDSVERLKSFEEAHEISFTLLSDPDVSAHKAFGAHGEKSLYGRLYKGVLRSTILIKDGKIQEALYNVKATGHTNMLLRRLGA
ncbi:MAG: peroxiredoxin [Aquiluna sp.]|nr:peroxiredoxin [Aquiluna sp.]